MEATNPLVDRLLEDLESAHARVGQLEQFRDYTSRALQPHTGSFELLSKRFEIPLKLQGVAITEGVFNGLTYTWEELGKAYLGLKGCPITVDHPIDSTDAKLRVRDEIGKISDVWLDEDNKSIRWKGFIVDEDIARRVFHNLVDSVSIGAAMKKQTNNGSILAHQIRFLELSIVKNPACKGARIEVLEKLSNGEFGINLVGVRDELDENEDAPRKGIPKTDKERLIAHFGEEVANKLLELIGDEVYKLLPPRGQKVKEEDNKMEVLGITPNNPAGYGKSTSPWTGPTLGSFTARSWAELTTAEKRKIASHFAWSRTSPPEKYGDLKLPHHNPTSHAVVWRGVAAAMAALGGARGGVQIPSADVSAVRSHLAAHYREFEKTPPKLEQVLSGDYGAFYLDLSDLKNIGGKKMDNEKQETTPAQETKEKDQTQKIAPVVTEEKIDGLFTRVAALEAVIKKLLQKAEGLEAKPEKKELDKPASAPALEEKEDEVKPAESALKEKLETLEARLEKLENTPDRVSSETGESKTKKEVSNEEICAWLAQQK